MESTKISECEVEISIEKPVETVTTKYERGFIEQQIINIRAQKDTFDALRDAEIAECREILGEMDKLGIVAKPAEIRENLEAPMNIKEI